MGKSDKEKKLLYEWGVANCDKYQFVEMNKDKDSYFEERRDDSYIREYYFDTIPELKDELNLLWGDDACMDCILQTVLVASMKNKVDDFKTHELIKGEQSKKSNENMPTFIYNF